jgi:C4-dicarboxylate-specific signal transduction histidine kinase
MDNILTRTASSALERASSVGSSIKQGVGHWVPDALRMVSTGAQLAVLRDGSRKAVKAVRRYPVAAAVTVAVAVGAGVALWVLRRRSKRRGLDEDMRAIEVKPVRVSRRNGAASRTAARRAARTTTASKPAATH